MINYDKELVSALNKVLPTEYEMRLTRKTKTPCITYQERNNYVSQNGDTIGYSKIIYTIKVWSNKVEDVNKYALEIDNVLRPLGFKRTSSNELHDNQSTMVQKIMTYEALALEEFK